MTMFHIIAARSVEGVLGPGNLRAAYCAPHGAQYLPLSAHEGYAQRYLSYPGQPYIWIVHVATHGALDLEDMTVRCRDNGTDTACALLSQFPSSLIAVSRRDLEAFTALCSKSGVRYVIEHYGGGVTVASSPPRRVAA